MSQCERVGSERIGEPAAGDGPAVRGIVTFPVEQLDGIADRVAAATSVAYLMSLTPNLERDGAAAGVGPASEGLSPDEDLFYLRDILATTGWNLNGDVFDAVETYAARHTARDKPFNIQHEFRRIIGHVVASTAVDAATLEPLPDGLDAAAVPTRFHVLNDSVLYRNVGDPEHAAFMDKTVEEIRRGDWCVSMECFFKGWDYAVIGPDGRSRVIRRDAESAFLTKHMLQYGGDGVYRDSRGGAEYRLGRLLRRLSFKGKGLVKKPANPESVILATSASAEFISIPADLGYLDATPVVALPAPTEGGSDPPEESPDMPETDHREVAMLEAQVAALRTEAEAKSARVAALESKDAASAASLADAAAQIQRAGAERDAATARAVAVEAAHAAAAARVAELEPALAVAESKLAEAAAAQAVRDRTLALTARGATEEVAAGLVAKLAALSDEAFAAAAEVLAPAWAPAPTPAPAPAPAPEPRPAQEPQPVPGSSTAAEIAAIDAATPEAEPDLASPVGDDAAEAARAELADFFATNVLTTTRGRKAAD